MSTQTETGNDKRLFIGGAFVEADECRTFSNRDPFTGDVPSEVAAGSRPDAERAVAPAAKRWITVQRGSHPFPF